jgi:DMSO/TMAO reductase YedYZ molybdopterin-dependent catalytic subunit
MSAPPPNGLSRRAFLALSAAGGAGLVVPASAASLMRLDQALTAMVECAPDAIEGARLAAIVPFSDAGQVRFGMLQGQGLDARLLTDLSRLTPETLVTPNEQFYIRTTAPAGLDRREPWTIALGGLVRRPATLALADLLPEASAKGPFVMECAGNSAAGAFGLMSAARWSGIPMADVLARVEALPSARRVLVSGVDHSEQSTTSTPGASWIFTLDDLRSSGAFLATAMNGERLPADHGYPVRLFMPGWYGCASIKWVNEISFVDHEAPSTPQMREFGPRTFQSGRPALARDYKPAIMDLAAMPVRVEQWVGMGGPVYRVVGVMWGGDAPADRLAIRFNPREPFVPLAVCPKPASADSWSLWSHIWRPMERGRYLIVLRAGDPGVRTERLDTYYYTREIQIDEV